ncbi:unnamed protein product [Schistosoma mattheei]|uniref:Uncharacterized protein n=1 Tax=Schistosoma mattheei TaxID=31246 RepID=A0A183PWU7_9TREM|nr:unnamed protein product [Schistosoma mattheei]
METTGCGTGAKMPQTFSNHIFKGLNSKLGQDVRCTLKHLVPVPKNDSERVVTWYEDDVICSIHYTYKYVDKKLELPEHGPSLDPWRRARKPGLQHPCRALLLSHDKQFSDCFHNHFQCFTIVIVQPFAIMFALTPTYGLLTPVDVHGSGDEKASVITPSITC